MYIHVYVYIYIYIYIMYHNAAAPLIRYMSYTCCVFTRSVFNPATHARNASYAQSPY